MTQHADDLILLAKNQGIFAPLRVSSAFTALWFGQSLSRFGDSLLFVILPLVVYSVSRSTLTMGVVMALFMLPMVLLLPITGLIADRMPRVPLMIWSDVVRFFLLGAMTVLAELHLLHISAICGFAFLFGMMDAVFQPAYSAVRAQVFTVDIRNAANSLTQISTQAAQLVGPALGGVIVSVWSVAVGFGVDAVTFLISIISLLFLRIDPLEARASTSTEYHAGGLQQFFHDLLEGYRELRKHDWLWMTILAFAFVNIAYGGVISILVPWLVKIHFAFSDTVYGLLMSASGGGAILSAFIFGRRQVWHHRGVLAYIGVAISGVSLTGLAVFHAITWLVVCMVLNGSGIMLFGLVWEGSLQELVPAGAYGRVASLDMLGSYALLPVGLLFTGWLSTSIGGVTAIWSEGIVVVVLALFMLCLAPIRHFR